MKMIAKNVLFVNVAQEHTQKGRTQREKKDHKGKIGDSLVYSNREERASGKRES